MEQFPLINFASPRPPSSHVNTSALDNNGGSEEGSWSGGLSGSSVSHRVILTSLAVCRWLPWPYTQPGDQDLDQGLSRRRDSAFLAELSKCRAASGEFSFP